jgi:hypothetical protein
LPTLIEFYEQLKPQDLDRLAQLYTEDCRFKDPFNEVQGVAAVWRIFAHMFETIEAPRFVVRDAFSEGDQAFLSWDFHAGRFIIRGATHLRFAPDGRVRDHRDYWDAAEELYEKLPVLGALMRLLRRKLAAS